MSRDPCTRSRGGFIIRRSSSSSSARRCRARYNWTSSSSSVSSDSDISGHYQSEAIWCADLNRYRSSKGGFRALEFSKLLQARASRGATIIGRLVADSRRPVLTSNRIVLGHQRYRSENKRLLAAASRQSIQDLLKHAYQRETCDRHLSSRRPVPLSVNIDIFISICCSVVDTIIARKSAALQSRTTTLKSAP